jgi:hypothetical protein
MHAPTLSHVSTTCCKLSTDLLLLLLGAPRASKSVHRLGGTGSGRDPDLFRAANPDRRPLVQDSRRGRVRWDHDSLEFG